MSRDSNNNIFGGHGANKDQWELTLLDYISGGAFVDYPGVDKKKVIDSMTAIFLGNAANFMWRRQRVFIMGGYRCDDNALGPGPTDYRFCTDDNRAWYIYHWTESQGTMNGLKAPKGIDLLGKGDYDGVKWQDVIRSSLASYEIAGYDYTRGQADEQIRKAVEKGGDEMFSPSSPGLFTIPVCDVSVDSMANDDMQDQILLPYGQYQNPTWCGPICDWDRITTDAFLEVTHIKDADWSVDNACDGFIN